MAKVILMKEAMNSKNLFSSVLTPFFLQNQQKHLIISIV